MNAYVSKEELALLPANRLGYPQHYADDRVKRQAKTGLVGRVRAWLARQQAMSELSNLTDRELEDIGLSRAEVGNVFKPGFASSRR